MHKKFPKLKKDNLDFIVILFNNKELLLNTTRKETVVIFLIITILRSLPSFLDEALETGIYFI